INSYVRTEAGRVIEPAARRAVEVWEAALGDVQSDAQTRDALRVDPTATRVVAAIQAEAAKLLDVTEPEQLPSPTAYNRRSAGFRDRMFTLARGELEATLLKAVLANQAGAVTPRMRGLAWLIRGLYDLAALVNTYQIADDLAFVQRWGRDDVRGAHRVRV